MRVCPSTVVLFCTGIVYCFLSRAGYHVVELIIWFYLQSYFSSGHVLVLFFRTALETLEIPVNQEARRGFLYRGLYGELS